MGQGKDLFAHPLTRKINAYYLEPLFHYTILRAPRLPNNQWNSLDEFTEARGCEPPAKRQTFTRLLGQGKNIGLGHSLFPCFFDVSFAAVLCLTSLADERYLGMQLILFATALMFLLYNWIMVCSLTRTEEPIEEEEPAEVSDGGFEKL